MTKWVKIDVCEDCPNYLEKAANASLRVGTMLLQGYMPVCLAKDEEPIQKEKGKAFPDSCPLEDVKT